MGAWLPLSFFKWIKCFPNELLMSKHTCYNVYTRMTKWPTRRQKKSQLVNTRYVYESVCRVDSISRWTYSHFFISSIVTSSTTLSSRFHNGIVCSIHHFSFYHLFNTIIGEHLNCLKSLNVLVAFYYTDHV